MKTNVGDIIYILDSKTHTIIPCKIVEIVSSLRLEGESTFHIAEAPSGKSFKIEDLKSPMFKTIEDAKQHLLDAAEKLIDLTAKKAIKSANEAFGVQESILENSINDLSDTYNEVAAVPAFSEGVTKVELADGQKANIILPEALIHGNSSTN